MVAQQINYVDNIIDKTALTITPTLMQPLKGKITWPLLSGGYRYIMARDGLYIEGRSDVLHACFKISDLGGRLMPYGELKPFCHFLNGLISIDIKEKLIDSCLESGTKEFAAYVRDDGAESYHIQVPAIISNSTSHISYVNKIDINNVLVDIHSHGFGEAYFSPTDDKSDQHGIYIAIVVGRCTDKTSIDIKSRIVIHGHFCPIDWQPWEDM